jgi:N-acetylglutamate synthase-like GNAT family acetyltransferase
MRFSLRVATATDSEQVSALLHASYSSLLRVDYPADLLLRALPLMTKANPRLLGSGKYLVAETVDGQIIGCGGWTHERPGTGTLEPGLGHVRHFAAHPSWTRRGIGRALLARCIEDAEADAVRALECYSTVGAERFYRSMEFETIGPIEIEMKPGLAFPSIHMKRTAD